LDISVFADDTVLELKTKILQILENNNQLKSKLKIKYNVIEALEIRMAEDENDHSPNMDFAPFDDKINLVKMGHRVLVIIIVNSIRQLSRTSHLILPKILGVNSFWDLTRKKTKIKLH